MSKLTVARRFRAPSRGVDYRFAGRRFSCQAPRQPYLGLRLN
jgi:hypothetical protein